MASRQEKVRRRSIRSWERGLDRALRLLGRVLGRPDENLLHELTGRSKGGPPGTVVTGYAQHLEKGRRALETQAFGEALFHFGQAVELRPKGPWAWHGRGDALQLSGDPAGALAAYDRALSHAPRLALAHNGRGNALESLGRLGEARAAWSRALELDPTLSWPRDSLARVGAAPESD